MAAWKRDFRARTKAWDEPSHVIVMQNDRYRVTLDAEHPVVAQAQRVGFDWLAQIELLTVLAQALHGLDEQNAVDRLNDGATFAYAELLDEPKPAPQGRIVPLPSGIDSVTVALAARHVATDEAFRTEEP